MKSCRQLEQKFRNKLDEPKFTMFCGLAYLRQYKISSDPTHGTGAVRYLKRSVTTMYSPSVMILLGKASILTATKRATFEQGLYNMWEGVEKLRAKEGFSLTPSATVVVNLVSYVDMIAKAALKYPKQKAYLRVLGVRLQNAWARLEKIDPQKYTNLKMRDTVKAARLYLADGAKAGDFDNGNVLAGIHWLRGRWYQRLYWAKPTEKANLRSARYHLRMALAKTRSPIDTASLHYDLARLESSCESKNKVVVLRCLQQALAHIESARSQKNQPQNRIRKQNKLYNEILSALVFIHQNQKGADDQRAAVNYAEKAYQIKLTGQGQDRLYYAAAFAAEKLGNKKAAIKFANKAYELTFAKYGLNLKKDGVSKSQIAKDAKLLRNLSWLATRFGEYERARFYQRVCVRFKENGCLYKVNPSSR